MNFAVTRRVVLLAACVAGFAGSGFAQDKPVSFKVPLSGAKEVPPVTTPATGTAEITYDPATRAVTWDITYSGLSGTATMAHFHLGPPTVGGHTPVMTWLSKKGSPAESPIKGEAALTPEQSQQFLAGDWYINVHTQANPGGEIRGQVVPPKS